MTRQSSRRRHGFTIGMAILLMLFVFVAAIPAQEFIQGRSRQRDTRSFASNQDFDSSYPTVYVYGGPSTVDGKFQTALVAPFTASSQGWTGADLSGAGNFSHFVLGVTDVDGCSDNPSGVAAFYDVGTTSPNWAYGVPGNYVVPYAAAFPIHNEIQSPEIPWNVPNSDYYAARLSFLIWKHLPLENGIGYYWKIRTKSGGVWGPWKNDGVVEYGNDEGLWLEENYVISHLLEPPFTDIQIALGVQDLTGALGLAGNDATLSPIFDDVTLQAFPLGGPIIVAQDIDLFQDGFPQSGLIDVSTQAARDQLDIRVDAARDDSPASPTNDPQDAVHVLVRSNIPGTGITDPSTQIQLVYSLSMNPVFESAIRGSAPVTGSGTGLYGWDESTGSVGASPAFDGFGNPISDGYAFDLPDADFLYPGDVLHYYIEAVDDDGRTTTLPDGPDLYDLRFTMRGLPSVNDFSGSQPDLLLINQSGHRGGENGFFVALDNLGMVLGTDYDVYTTKAPELLEPNSIGSAGSHGATAIQLAGYHKILYLAGNLDRNVLSNGQDNNLYVTAADDISALTAWSNDGEERSIALFGTDIATVPEKYTEGDNYLLSELGVQYSADTLTSSIPQTPDICPVGVSPYMDPYAVGPCGIHADFDEVLPTNGGVVVHRFGTGMGCGTYDKVASILRQSGVRKYHTHVFDLESMIDPSTPKNATAVSRYLGQVLADFGQFGSGPATTTPVRLPAMTIAAYPNPANPALQIQLAMPLSGQVALEIFDLQGRFVRTLFEGFLESGTRTLQWDGADQTGSQVASGAYVVRATHTQGTSQIKVALIR